MTSSFVFIYHSQRMTLVRQTLSGTHLTILPGQLDQNSDLDTADAAGQMGDIDDDARQWSTCSTSSEESDEEESLGESERFPDSAHTSGEGGRAAKGQHGRGLSYMGQRLARGHRIQMVPAAERNEAEASARGGETNRDQTTTASSAGAPAASPRTQQPMTAAN